MSDVPYFKRGGKAASRPAPMIARSAADVDEFGWPKAPIDSEEALTEEQLLEHERKRKELLEQKGPPDMMKRCPVQPVEPLTSHMTQDEFDNLDYPKPPEYMTPEWMLEQMELEKVDPRVNPNLLLDETQQEYWNSSARKPYAKAILRSEQHWTNRRNVWLRQYETVEKMNNCREEVAELLEDCTPEVKRLITPIMHHRITEVALWNALREAHAFRLPFSQVLDQPEKQKQFQSMRLRIDQGGEEAAGRMMEEYNARSLQCMMDNKKRQEEENRGKRVVESTDMLAKHLNMAQKCRKDGYIEWHKGDIEEALGSWRQADAHLKMYKAPDHDRSANRMIAEMHVAVLKNLSQAAIRLGFWTEALEAADDALRIDDQDHKAWFRKACALEGLGRYEEAEEALSRIGALAVGRPDRERIEKECRAKRENFQLQYARDRLTSQRGVQRALVRGVFGGDRITDALDQDELPLQAGDVVYMKDDFADFERGHRGVILEIDEDGDARIQFDGQEEVEMLLSEDLVNLSRHRPPPEERSKEPGQHLEKPLGLAHPDHSESEAKRKRLTKEGVLDLLQELKCAYESHTLLQKQVAKLARDIRWQKDEFLLHLPKVALEAQRPILEKWGFEPSLAGASEMQLAVEDHLREGEADPALHDEVAEVGRALYGEMYPVLFGSVSAAPQPPTCQPAEVAPPQEIAMEAPG